MGTPKRNCAERPELCLFVNMAGFLKPRWRGWLLQHRSVGIPQRTRGEISTQWSTWGIGLFGAAVLLNHDLRRDGTVRDVVVFSIIDSQWKTVRLSLQQMLTRRTFPSIR
jgi:hypothetical protein